MASRKNSKELLEAFEEIALNPNSKPKQGDFGGSKRAQKNASDFSDQNFNHRDNLIKLVTWLSSLSFLLFSIIIIHQMIVRLFIKDYVGVSPDVLKVLAISVFGQVITVVGSIALYVWRQK